MKISTRTRAMLLALTIGVVFFVLQGVNLLDELNINFEFDFLKMLILGVLMYVGLIWVMSFRVGGERFITVLLFPSMAIAVMTLYVNLIIDSILSSVDKVVSEILASIVITIFSYILILTANILNVGFLQKIPLTQAGRAAHYVLTLIVSYLFFSLLFSNPIAFMLKIILVFVIAYLFSTIALWNIDIQNSHRFISSLGIALMLTSSAFVLILWPIGSEYVALILSLLYYISLGIALEIREVLSRRVWLEYGLLYFVIITILLLISNWGINGRLL